MEILPQGVAFISGHKILLVVCAVLILVVALCFYFRKALGEDKNHNVIMMLLGIFGLIAALWGGRTIIVKIDTLGSVISGFYSQYTDETIPQNDPRVKFVDLETGGSDLHIDLIKSPIKYSELVWYGRLEGMTLMDPSSYELSENHLVVHFPNPTKIMDAPRPSNEEPYIKIRYQPE